MAAFISEFCASERQCQDEIPVLPEKRRAGELSSYGRQYQGNGLLTQQTVSFADRGDLKRPRSRPGTSCFYIRTLRIRTTMRDWSNYFTGKWYAADSDLPRPFWRQSQRTSHLRNRESPLLTARPAEAQRGSAGSQGSSAAVGEQSAGSTSVRGTIITQEQICIWQAASYGELNRFAGSVCARRIVPEPELFKSRLEA